MTMLDPYPNFRDTPAYRLGRLQGVVIIAISMLKAGCSREDVIEYLQHHLDKDRGVENEKST